MYFDVGALMFNQDIGNWNTSNVIDMSQMFARARAFNQNIKAWDTCSVINMHNYQMCEADGLKPVRAHGNLEATTSDIVELNPPESQRSYSSTWENVPGGCFRAQSCLDSPSHWHPHSGRMHTVSFVTIDIGYVTNVHGVVIQGVVLSKLNKYLIGETFRYYVSTLRVEISLNGNSWAQVANGKEQEFETGAIESEADQKKWILFPTPVRARYVRLLPVTFYPYPSFRVFDHVIFVGTQS